MEYKRLNFTIWDVGGNEKIRQNWKQYYHQTQGVIFVIDSGDRERLGESKAELERMLAEAELKGAKLLIFVNKQDLPNAMSVGEVTEGLGLRTLKSGHTWFVKAASAKTGSGLSEGLDWLSEVIQPH